MKEPTTNQPSPTKPLPLPLIHINGYPGTGKLTIAQQLLTKLNSTAKIPAKLIHNHLLINPADAILHRTQPGYQTLRKKLRAAVLSSLEQEPATYQTAYIFTDFQSSDTVGAGVCAEYASTAAKRGCRLLSVVLHCGEEENLRRLVEVGRAAAGKLTDWNVVRGFREGGASIYCFDGESKSLEIDVTTLSSEETALLILDHVLKVLQRS